MTPRGGIAERIPRTEGMAIRRSPVAVVVAVCAVIALALRVWWLSRPGHLLGVTEADDGVLFGNALRLVNGVIPYRDFSDVQPPGSFLIMAPVALLAKVTGSAWGLAITRMLTVAADTACVVLIGRLVRHRGALTAGIACGIYAVYPDALIASHTFLLEPWLNLFCLAGAVAVFEGDRSTASGRRLFLGGLAFGFAAAIKLWGLVPLVIVMALLLTGGWRRLARFAAGAVAGFGLPALPFWLLAPSAFTGGVFTGQFVRSDAGQHQVLLRLADLAGNQVIVHLANADTITLVAVAGAVVLTGYLAERPRALDIYVVTSCVAVVVMLMLPRLYYSHYGAFAAPFVALALALPAGRLARLPGRAGVLALAVPAIVLLAIAGIRDVGSSPRQWGPSVATARQLIPAGACVLTDTPSYTVMADRFTAATPGCPALVDAQGTLIAMTDGRELDATRNVLDPVTGLWGESFLRAQYVWLFPGSGSRIPWTGPLHAYFVTHFRLIAFGSTRLSGGDVPPSGLYQRR